LFSLPVGTEMFHFPTFPPLTLCVQVRVTGHDSCRVSPFGHPRITARLAAPRGLSQPPTSFFGSWCQGIHRAPLLTWPQRLRCSRPLCSSQETGGIARRARRSAPAPTNGGRCVSRPTRLAPGGDKRPAGGRSAVPSGPNSVPGLRAPSISSFPSTRIASCGGTEPDGRSHAVLVNVPPMSSSRRTCASGQLWTTPDRVGASPGAP
jgi:hypothetical protein